jgi:hypothetical protein
MRRVPAPRAARSDALNVYTARLTVGRVLLDQRDVGRKQSRLGSCNDVPLLLVKLNRTFECQSRFAVTTGEQEDLAEVSMCIPPTAERVARLRERHGLASQCFGSVKRAAASHDLGAHGHP